MQGLRALESTSMRDPTRHTISHVFDMRSIRIKGGPRFSQMHCVRFRLRVSSTCRLILFPPERERYSESGKPFSVPGVFRTIVVPLGATSLARRNKPLRSPYKILKLPQSVPTDGLFEGYSGSVRQIVHPRDTSQRQGSHGAHGQRH